MTMGERIKQLRSANGFTQDRYSNRMSLPKDGMTLAKNDNILLRAVSEGQKDYMFRVFRKQEYILFWSRKMKKLIYIN